MINYTRCGRKSELIINKNNILRRVINTNFSMSQFTLVLIVFLHSFTFCVQCLLDGHHPPQFTGAHELTLNLLTTTIVAPPGNASKWQMGFNSAFKGMHEKPTNTPIIHSVY